ncbi:MAG: MFS transporter [Dehalococcoidia bacterium]|nr:MFS transporter [Dehalococcoidia bacterium]
MSKDNPKETGASKPRGLFYGWIIVMTIAASNFAQTGEFNPVLAVFMKPMSDDMGWSRSQISLSISIGSIIGAVLAPISGQILDRYGPRVTMSIGQFLYSGSLFSTGLAQHIWQFWMAFSFGRGMVLGVTGLAGNVAVSNWFIRRRGRAVSLASLGTRAGQASLPLLCQFLLSRFGWRTGWNVLGIIGWVVAMVPSLLFLRHRPETMGLLPDGDPPISSSAAAAGASEIDDGERLRAVQRVLEPSWSLGEAVRTRALWLVALASAQASIVGAGVNLHLVPYMTDKGIDPFVAVGATSLLFVMGGVGGIVWGFLAEKFPIRMCSSLSLILSAVLVVALMKVDGKFTAYLFAVGYGFIIGGWQILNSLMLANYFGRRSLGSITGLIAPFQLTANSIGPIAAGLAYDMTGGYAPAFTLFVVSYTLAAFWMLLAKPPAPKPADIAA